MPDQQETRMPTWRPRFSERDMQILHGAVYSYLQKQGGYDREVEELLERIEQGHTDVFVRARTEGRIPPEDPRAAASPVERTEEP